MKVISVFIIIIFIFCKVEGRYVNKKTFLYNQEALSKAIRDMISKIPSENAAIVVDKKNEKSLLPALCNKLFNAGISASFMTVSYKAKTTDNELGYLNPVYNHLKRQTASFTGVVYVFITYYKILEDLIKMIAEENFARRNIIYIYVWNDKPLTTPFYTYMQEAMRICVIRNPRPGIYQVLYNQAKSQTINELVLVNWWSPSTTLFKSPLLPSTNVVYKNFHGRIFNVPVLHKPPWNFVIYSNDSIQVEGGRDDKLLSLISSKLNFGYRYFDPPDRSQGSAFVNGTMQGVLGLIWKREVELFIGDLSVTYERSLAVEFSFITLADSEAFITHAPGKLSEALAIIRPFHWQVWPPVIGTIIIAGPVLFFFIRINPRSTQHDKSEKLANTVWLTTAIFLRQSATCRTNTNQVRILVALFYLASTYVISDMYSAQLTSILASPAREKPIDTLSQLNYVMKYREFQLYVEKHSASHGILENGTGYYKSIWEMMQKQKIYLLDSTEDGMLKVRDSRTSALIGGRETFIYDMRRFGSYHFHLSDKMYTRYSAVGLQIGCPYIENFNKILMLLFEAGIMTKITNEEYQKLGEKLRVDENNEPSNITVMKELFQENTENNIDEDDDDDILKAMSMKTLQGAFLLLIFGYCFAGIILIGENLCNKTPRKQRKFSIKFIKQFKEKKKKKKEKQAKKRRIDFMV